MWNTVMCSIFYSNIQLNLYFILQQYFVISLKYSIYLATKVANKLL